LSTNVGLCIVSFIVPPIRQGYVVVRPRGRLI